MKKLFSLIFLIGVLSGAAQAAGTGISASVDRNHIANGETVRLLIQREGNNNGQPDLSPLKADFDILSSNSSSSVQINNGAMSAQTQLELILAPKHDGALRIPAIEWNGARTDPIDLNVGGAANPGKPDQQGDIGNEHVSVSAVADQTRPYVQAAVVLNVRVVTDLPLMQANLELPANDAVLVKQLGKDQQSNEMRNGHRYAVIERKYLLFPQKSGRIMLDGPVLAALVPDTSHSDPFFDDFFQNSPMASMMQAKRPLRLHGKAIELNVQPRPADLGAANWVPALSVKLSETWSPDGSSVHVGEPVTRRIDLEALGLTGAQLPDLAGMIAAPDGIKLYPDQAKISDSAQGESVLGSRTQNIALIAAQPGHYTMPEVRLSWWDTINNVARVAVLPAHEFDVLPADPNAPAPQTPATPPSTPPVTPHTPSLDAANPPGNPLARTAFDAASVWIWASCGFALLWLLTLLAWWLSRRPAAASNAPQRVEGRLDDSGYDKRSATQLFKAFHEDCRNNDPGAARYNLLLWAKAYWSDNAPLGLNALAHKIGDAQLAVLLRELDRCCYTNSPWCGAALSKALAKPPVSEQAATTRTGLMELYP